jgi:hypothetical protein
VEAFANPEVIHAQAKGAMRIVIYA